MKIAVLGAGFAGLSAAYHLGLKGHNVYVFEKEPIVGGLAVGFKEKNWEWQLERHYHHFFTSDSELISLAQKLNIPLIFPKSLTSLYFNGRIYPFNTPADILNFSPLPFFDRIRLGFVSLLLKLLPQKLGQKFETQSSMSFAKKLFGEKAYRVVWEPLLKSKFGSPAGGFSDKINAAWLWARIKKRTLKLGYVEGGFQIIAEALAKKIEEQGGKIYLNTEIKEITQKGNKIFLSLRGASETRDEAILSTREIATPLATLGARNDKIGKLFNIVISTLPTIIFSKLVSGLPKSYVQKLNSIPHLHALNLVLELKKPFFKDTYWLNINDEKFPFLCVVQHTNFIDKKHYGGNHVLYVSNYLPFGHPYFNKSAEELLEIYLPYLRKINSAFLKLYIINCKLFLGPFAQPVFVKNYSQRRPFGKTPLANLYFANLDSVYPWDRGTNYALELGRKIAQLI